MFGNAILINILYINTFIQADLPYFYKQLLKNSKMKNITLHFLLAIILYSCSPSPKPNENNPPSQTSNETNVIMTGGAKMILVDGKYNVWTKKFGDGKIKVLLLHGGPGFSHDYFECFEDFLPKEGIEFYYYDQLGCGYSDNPADTSLWNISRYVEEVEQVRKGLGLDNFYLLGHSWGSMLAYDEMNPEDMKREGRLIPNSRTYLCPNGSHMSMYDDQQNYFTSLIGFIKDVDGNTFVADKK